MKALTIILALTLFMCNCIAQNKKKPIKETIESIEVIQPIRTIHMPDERITQVDKKWERQYPIFSDSITTVINGWDTFRLTKLGDWTLPVKEPVLDTVKVLMLLTHDTTTRYETKNSMVYEYESYMKGIHKEVPYKETKTILPYYSVYWQYGYLVASNASPFTLEVGGYHPPFYLDMDKKPLPKNIIVWQRIVVK